MMKSLHDKSVDMKDKGEEILELRQATKLLKVEIYNLEQHISKLRVIQDED